MITISVIVRGTGSLLVASASTANVMLALGIIVRTVSVSSTNSKNEGAISKSVMLT